MGFSTNKIINALKNISLHGQIRREAGNQNPSPTWKITSDSILVRTVFTILVRIPPRKVFGPLGKEPLGPIASRGRFVRPAVKYVDDKIIYQDAHILYKISYILYEISYILYILSTFLNK